MTVDERVTRHCPQRTLPSVRALTALTLIGVLALAGCGAKRSDGLGRSRTTATTTAPKPPPDQTPAVRAAVADFARAIARKDYRALCTRVLARDLVDRINRANLPCEQTLKVGLQEVRNPRLVLQGVTVTGTRAMAQVRSSADGQTPFDGSLALTHEPRGWKVASLVAPAG
jgi:hypothetical protein